jgi:hypothetical protein
MENVSCFIRVRENIFWIFVYTETRYEPTWFLGINFVLVAAKMRVSEPLVSNRWFVLLKYSDFQLSCHNIVSKNIIKIQHDMAKLFVIPIIAYYTKNVCQSRCQATVTYKCPTKNRVVESRDLNFSKTVPVWGNLIYEAMAFLCTEGTNLNCIINTDVHVSRRIVVKVILLFFFIILLSGVRLSLLILRPLLSYCTSPRW